MILMRLTYDIWRREIRRRTQWVAGRPLRILECGCGPGLLTEFMEEWFPTADLTALDLEKRLLEAASERASRAWFALASAEHIPLTDDTFDVVIALHMVEHLSQPVCFIKEAKRILNCGGHLIIATPNPEGIGARFMGSCWSGWKDPGHISLKAPNYWRELLLEFGFRIVREGTTGLSGIPIFRVLPVALVNWVPLFVFGFFSWQYGESYVCVAESI